MEIRVTRARKVFSDGKHNAFTGIAAAYGKVFITFRSGKNHMSLDGTIKVITSMDMEAWQVVTEVRRQGGDLRDPKPVLFGKKLMVFFGERRGDKTLQSFVIQTSDGVNFDEPVPLRGIPEGRWLWHVQPFGNKLYGTAYCAKKGSSASLHASDDGQTWEQIGDFPVPGNEVYLDFDREGIMWSLIRDDDHGCIPTVCIAEPPYSSFRSATRLPMRLQAPMIKRLEGGCVVVCRQWDEPGWLNIRTDLFWMEDGKENQRLRTLPSGGDTSYAGWLDLEKGRAIVSYYSSHEYKMDKPFANNAVVAQEQSQADRLYAADIFLADISYA